MNAALRNTSSMESPRRPPWPCTAGRGRTAGTHDTVILAQKNVPGHRPGDDDPLLPHHRKELEEGSGLSPAMIAEAGYFSADNEQVAELLGWSGANPKLGSALVIPLGGPDEPDGPSQAKYDAPRKGGGTGKPSSTS